MAPTLPHAFEACFPQSPDDFGPRKQPAPPVSRREFDCGDDRRLHALRKRHVFKVELQGLLEVRQGLLDALALTRNLDLEAARDGPGRLVGDDCRESHAPSLRRERTDRRLHQARAAPAARERESLKTTSASEPLGPGAELSVDEYAVGTGVDDLGFVDPCFELEHPGRPPPSLQRGVAQLRGS
jgi:hypothetical protein